MTSRYDMSHVIQHKGTQSSKGKVELKNPCFLFKYYTKTIFQKMHMIPVFQFLIPCNNLTSVYKGMWFYLPRWIIKAFFVEISLWLICERVFLVFQSVCSCSGGKLVRRPHCWVSVVSPSLGVQGKHWSHKGSMFPSHCCLAHFVLSVKELYGFQIPFHMSVCFTTFYSLVQHFLFQFKRLHLAIPLGYVALTQQEQSEPKTQVSFFLQSSHISTLLCMGL